MEDEERIAKRMQKLLLKLISEEIIAADLYNGAVNSVVPEQAAFIAKKFKEIAEDETNDHRASLEKFALQNEFKIPFKYKDVEKYAERELVSLFNSLKEGEDAVYYIVKAIRSEELAIKSFQESLADEWLYDELQPILLKCYYDEIQHL